ncbi:FlgB family protein [Chachezhania antarctica]|uniref:FlgB family protein n=1 Tax=Chachezhania antarctica TaxID=2340860 RepID=UPI000EACD6C3|nr:FlgB family protein [Chachezhania antarctica]|tara:strand:- start:13460 stop:13849 length:390 start_codon:yes stop_codon:yes gene_type:complete
MFAELNVFRMAHGMAFHAGQRQSVIAQNMANSDTPGHRARDLVPFTELVARGADTAALRATRPGHLGDTGDNPFHSEPTQSSLPLAEGQNAISVEEEMVKAVETKRQHDRALAIYRSSLTLLRTSLGRG